MDSIERADFARSQLMYDASRKSNGVAYVLWFFLGGLGAHRFYLGSTGPAIVQLIMFVLGWLTVILFVGFLLLIPLGIWVLVDAFLIPGMVREHNMKLADALTGGQSVLNRR